MMVCFFALKHQKFKSSLIIFLNQGFFRVLPNSYSSSERIFSVVKNIIYLTFFACSKERSCHHGLGDSTSKEKAPFAQSRKTGFPCTGIFAVGVTNLSRSEACRAYTALLCGVQRHVSERSNLITEIPRSLLRGVSISGDLYEASSHGRGSIPLF
jgi:hypothetical protein